MQDFDWQLYLDLYPHLRSSGILSETEAKKHYLAHGKREGRIFKVDRGFNAEDYLSRYPDLKKNGISTARDAFIHYIQFGKKEGRVFKRLRYNPPPSKRSIAILLTIYYPEIENELVDYVKRIPFKTYIYISTPHDQIFQKVQKKLGDHTVVRTPYVKYGMDIGNYIMQLKFLDDSYTKHDFYLKIHSKQSQEWRVSMLESLLPFSIDDYEKMFNLLKEQHFLAPGIRSYPIAYNRANEAIIRKKLQNTNIDTKEVYPDLKFDSDSFDAESYFQFNYDLKRLFSKLWNNGSQQEVLSKCTEHYKNFVSPSSYQNFRISKKVTNPKDYKFVFSAGTMFWHDHKYIEEFIKTSGSIDSVLDKLSSEQGRLVNDRDTETHSLEYWFGIVAGSMNQKKLQSIKTVNFMLPPLGENTIVSGGFRTVFRHAQYLRTQNYNITLQVMCDDLTRQREFISRFDILDNIDSIKIYNAKDTCYADIHIATGWHSYKKCQQYEAKGFNTCFFCQDLEYKFDIPQGVKDSVFSFYKETRPTFTMSLYLKEKLKELNDSATVSTKLLVDQSIYKNSTSPQNRSGICILYDGDKPHRLPKITEKLITDLSNLFPQENIYLFGNTQKIKNKKFPQNVKNLGIISPEKLNELYNQCKVGTCFSTTNPSRIGFEMISSGCVCVEIDCESTRHDLPQDMFLLCRPNEDSISQGVQKLLTDQNAYNEIYKNIKNYKQQKLSEEELFCNMLEDVFYK